MQSYPRRHTVDKKEAQEWYPYLKPFQYVNVVRDSGVLHCVTVNTIYTNNEDDAREVIKSWCRERERPCFYHNRTFHYSLVTDLKNVSKFDPVLIMLPKGMKYG